MRAKYWPQYHESETSCDVVHHGDHEDSEKREEHVQMSPRATSSLMLEVLRVELFEDRMGASNGTKMSNISSNHSTIPPDSTHASS